MHRILVVGTGSIGERHARCMQKTGRAEVGICEVNADLRKTVAERYGFSKAYGTLGEALEQRWDAAVIAAPANVHIPLAREAAEAGVHLYIEKPFSTTTEGITDLVQLVNSRGLHAAVAYVYRAHPALQAMKKAIDSGRFGAPVQVSLLGGQHFPTFRPAYRDIYYADRATGGGAIQDALTHMFNACEWLVGPITRISVDAEHKVLEGVPVEDTVHAIARHGSIMGSYCLNQHAYLNENMVTVYCEKGMARFEVHTHQWRWMDEPNGEWHAEAGDIKERDDWFIRQETAFLDVLEGKAKPLCTLEEGLQTLHVNLAALKSWESRQWVPVGPLVA